MEPIDDKLLQFFTDHYKPGIIGIIGTTGTMGLAIREAQRFVTVDGKASLWSHCFVFGDLRLDRRGDGGTKTRSPYIFESDLKVNAFKPQLRNGAQENWIGKYCRGQVENAAVIDFGLSENQTEDVLATALQLVDEQVLYPIQELLGTWWAIITKQEWLTNPVDDPHAMYCSAFVRHCYNEGGADFLDQTVSISNTTPEHVAQAGIQGGKLMRYEP